MKKLLFSINFHPFLVFISSLSSSFLTKTYLIVPFNISILFNSVGKILLWSGTSLLNNIVSNYGCELLVENATLEQIKDFSLPNDTYQIHYKVNNNSDTHVDLCRGTRVKIFDLYYDNGDIVKTDVNENLIITLNSVVQKAKSFVNPSQLRKSCFLEGKQKLVISALGEFKA